MCEDATRRARETVECRWMLRLTKENPATGLMEIVKMAAKSAAVEMSCTHTWHANAWTHRIKTACPTCGAAAPQEDEDEDEPAPDTIRTPSYNADDDREFNFSGDSDFGTNDDPHGGGWLR